MPRAVTEWTCVLETPRALHSRVMYLQRKPCATVRFRIMGELSGLIFLKEPRCRAHQMCLVSTAPWKEVGR